MRSEESEEEITNRSLNENEDAFTLELREKLLNYEHRLYEKNGFTYIRFSDYSVRFNNKFFNSIKDRLNVKSQEKI